VAGAAETSQIRLAAKASQVQAAGVAEG